MKYTITDTLERKEVATSSYLLPIFKKAKALGLTSCYSSLNNSLKTALFGTFKFGAIVRPHECRSSWRYLIAKTNDTK